MGGSAHDVHALAKRAKAAGTLPRLQIDCGVDDYLIDANRALHTELTRLAVPHSYAEYPGSHEWDYWDRHLPEAIAFHLNNE